MKSGLSALRTLCGLIAVTAAGLFSGSATAEGVDRWYTDAQVEEGRPIYAENCAFCHGDRGEGQPNWQERDSMGFYPAPPLDDSGHADEHPLKNMLETLNLGGGPFGGTMPSFSDVLSEEQMKAVLAYIQSLWPDEVYAGWREIDAGRVVLSGPEHEGHH